MSGVDIIARGLGTQARAKAIGAQQRAWFNLRRVGQSVMASPPTVTTGNSASLASPFFYRATDEGGINFPVTPTNRFTFTRGAVKGGVPGNYVAFDNVTVNSTPTYGPNGYGISFVHTGQAFELVLSDTSAAHILVKVDDQYVTLTPLTTHVTSGLFYAKYDFGSAASRRIDVIGDNIYFQGVNIAATDSLDPAPVRGPRAIVLCDSFGGAGTAGAASSFVAALADRMGWDDVWSSSVGGTGYLATNGGTAPTFRGRVARDVIGYSPDVVLVAGSVNDDASTPSAVGAEAALLYAQLRTSLPNALVFASPNATGGPRKWTANKLAIKAAMKAAAQAAGVIWIDPLEMPISFAGAPITGLLKLAASAGATTLATQTAAGTNGQPQPGSTIELGSGATLERVQVKTGGGGGADYRTATIDGTLQYAHSVGEVWTQVGGSYLTGSGRVGATAGWGNADLNVSSDGTHPTDAGGRAYGSALETLMRQAARAL